MKATLTYRDRDRKLVESFDLDRPMTVVGRRPSEVCHLPEVAEKLGQEEPFQVHLEDTLYIVFPFENRLSRRHFSIRRTTDESGQDLFLIQDLGSCCGIWVNGSRMTSEERPLSCGDIISVGSMFFFRLVDEDTPGNTANPK